MKGIIFAVLLLPAIAAGQTIKTVAGTTWTTDVKTINGMTAATVKTVAGVDAPAGGGGCQEPTFRAAADAESGAASSVTVTKPTGTASGELMVAIVNWNTNGTITPPSGWTEKNTVTAFSGGTTGLYYKVAGGSEPADYTWSFSNGNQRVSAAIATFSGSYATDPQEGAYSENENAIDFYGWEITTTQDCAIVVYLSAYDEPFGDTWSAPSGWTIATANDGSGNCVIGYKYFATAGFIPDAQFTNTNLSAEAHSYLWAFIRND